MIFLTDSVKMTRIQSFHQLDPNAYTETRRVGDLKIIKLREKRLGRVGKGDQPD